MAQRIDPAIRRLIERGLVIPASPLALDRNRRFDPRRQRALWRYYAAAGAGGIAVGVHTTQFAIREPKIGLFEPVLSLAAEEFDRLDARGREPLVRIVGICGRTGQAVAEATLARGLRYHAGLLSLVAMRDADEEALLRIAGRWPKRFRWWASISSRPSAVVRLLLRVLAAVRQDRRRAGH